MGDDHPNEKTSLRILQLSCPEADPERRESYAYFVSKRNCTIDEAIARLEAETAGKKRSGDSNGTRKAEPAAAVRTNGTSSSSSSGSGSRPQPQQQPQPPQQPHSARLAPSRCEPTAAPGSSPPDANAAWHQSSSPSPSPSLDHARASLLAPVLIGRLVAPGPAGGTTTTTSTGPGPAKSRTAATKKAKSPPRPNGSGEGGVKSNGGGGIFSHVAVASSSFNRSAVTNADDPRHRVIHDRHDGTGAGHKKLIHYYYGESAAAYDTEVLASPGQCVLFTTSMTSDRRVRDHCRQLETLLYIKQIPHHVMDVADNAFLQKKAREIFRAGTGDIYAPDMPMLAVDEKYVGSFEEIQEMEDCGEFNRCLLELGFDDPALHRARPDFFDASKREANLAIMTPTSGRNAQPVGLPRILPVNGFGAGVRPAAAVASSSTTVPSARTVTTPTVTVAAVAATPTPRPRRDSIATTPIPTTTTPTTTTTRPIRTPTPPTMTAKEAAAHTRWTAYEIVSPRTPKARGATSPAHGSATAAALESPRASAPATPAATTTAPTTAGAGFGAMTPMTRTTTTGIPRAARGGATGLDGSFLLNRSTSPNHCDSLSNTTSSNSTNSPRRSSGVIGAIRKAQQEAASRFAGSSSPSSPGEKQRRTAPESWSLSPENGNTGSNNTTIATTAPRDLVNTPTLRAAAAADRYGASPPHQQPRQSRLNSGGTPIKSL